MNIKRSLLNNIGLKMLALLLAFVTWFYIGDATKLDSEKTVLQKLLPISHYTSKKLYIKPVFVGEVPKGFVFLKNDVTVTPEYIMVLGPSKILAKKDVIHTKPINLSEHTKTKTLDVELDRISRLIKFQKTKVELYLPVEKQEDAKMKE